MMTGRKGQVPTGRPALQKPAASSQQRLFDDIDIDIDIDIYISQGFTYFYPLAPPWAGLVYFCLLLQVSYEV